MGTETIELLKGYDPNKMKFPASVMEKLDGVPVKIQYNKQGNCEALTRQGEEVYSIQHILDAAEAFMPVGAFMVGELYNRNLPFKTISGKVRDTKQRHEDLALFVFDYGMMEGNDPWCIRYASFQRHLLNSLQENGLMNSESCIRIIPKYLVFDDEEVQVTAASMESVNPDMEGVVIHSHSKVWSPGKRTWGTQKLKAKPTVDLKIVGFEEAISADGERLGMVGRINALYKGKVIGVGPGKLNHEERKKLWRLYVVRGDIGEPDIAEVQYMKDDTYDALRQPTFQRWRPEKNAESLD